MLSKACCDCDANVGIIKKLGMNELLDSSQSVAEARRRNDV